MTNKKYTHVGVCTNPVGKTKLHFTNDPVVQTKKMDKQGYTRAVFTELPRLMEKPEAAKYLSTKIILPSDTEAQKACEHVIDRFPELVSPKLSANSTANFLG